MVPPIATIAPEVLDQILSFVSDLDLFLGLLVCGNKILSSLLSRSVRKLSLARPTAERKKLFWPAHRLQLLTHLTTFTMTDINLSPAASSALVNYLPKSLVKLHLEVVLGRETWLRPKQELDPVVPSLNTSVPADMTLGTLRERFPRLEHCHLPTSAVPTAWPTETVLYFVQTLPRSITYLHLPSLSVLPSMVWSLLPPHLHTLKGRIKALSVEDEALPPSLAASLACLSLNTRHVSSLPSNTDSTSSNPGSTDSDASSQREKSINDMEKLAGVSLPSSLTELTTTFPIMHPSGYPATLTSITLVGNPPTWRATTMPCSALFEWIPASITSLTLQNIFLVFDLPSESTDEATWLRLRKPGLRRFVAHRDTHAKFSSNTESDNRYDRVMEKLMPSLEYIDHDTRNARFRSPFIKRAALPLPAASELPNLQELEIRAFEDMEYLSHRNIGLSVPKTLTSLRITTEHDHFHDQDLLNLPPCLTDLSLRALAITGGVEEILASFLKLSSSPSTSVLHPSPSILVNTFFLISKADILDIPRCGARLELHRNEGDRPRFLLRPLARFEEPVKLWLMTEALHKLPSTLTALHSAIETPMAAIQETPIVSAKFPLLNSVLLYCPITDFSLRYTDSVRSVEYLNAQFELVPETGFQGLPTLPPYLESYKIGFQLNPTTNLPSTLTSLSIASLEAMTEPLRSLPSLTSLEFTSKAKLAQDIQEAIYLLNSCPTLTRLEARLELQIQKLVLFPNLRVWSGALVSDTVLYSLETRNQQNEGKEVYLENATLVAIETPDLFVSVANLPLVQIQSFKTTIPTQDTEKIVVTALEDAYTCLSGGTRMKIPTQASFGTSFVSSFLNRRKRN